MKVIAILLKASWQQVTIAILTGLISGACSARSIAIINQAILTTNISALLIEFAILAVIALVTGIVSQFLLTALSQKAIYDFRLSLSRAILAAPLTKLEMLGSSSLMTSLTGDVMTLSNTILILPFLCIDIAIIGGCLWYLASLSISVFAIALLLMVGGIGSV